MMQTVLSTCSPITVLNALAPRRGIRVIRCLRYAPGERHGLDVHAPIGAVRLPVVVFIHGGGWTGTQDRQVLPRKTGRLAVATRTAAGGGTALSRYRPQADPGAFARVLRRLAPVLDDVIPLGAFDHSVDAIAVYNDLLVRLGTATELPLCKIVAKAEAKKNLQKSSGKSCAEQNSLHQEVAAASSMSIQAVMSRRTTYPTETAQGSVYALVGVIHTTFATISPSAAQARKLSAPG